MINKKIIIKQGGAALWVAVILIIVIGIAGIVMLAQNKKSDNTGNGTSLLPPITGNDHIKGNNESAITLIEYSDFQCPACGDYYPLLKKLNEEFGDKTRFVYRHFPLEQHQNAKPAAVASEAAAKQGKFWEMHDMIFENQGRWSEEKNAEEIFTGYVQKLGLNMEQFKNDLASQEVKEKVDNDYKGGVKARVNATPSFFLNGKIINTPRNYNEFKQLIQQAARDLK